MPPNDQEPAYRLVDPSTGDIVGSFYENGSGDVEIQPSNGTQYKFAQSPTDNVDVARLQDTNDSEVIKKETKTFSLDATQSIRQTFTFSDLDNINVVSLTLDVDDTGNSGEVTYSESADPSSSTVDFVYSKFLNSDVSPNEIGIDITGTGISSKILNAKVIIVYI